MTSLFFHHLEAIFGWVWAASWQASVLAILVLLAQRLLGTRLNPRWRYALWLLVLVRLVLPALPESALSLFQFAPPPPAVIVVPVTEPLFVAAPLSTQQINQVSLEPSYPFSLYSLLAIIWLTGAVVLFFLTWQVNRRFSNQIAHSPEIADPELLDLFATAKTELGIRRPIRLIENSHVQSPAIMGLFQPTLLLPTQAREKFDITELRFIFLHELAHLKRGDVIVQGLIALLQIVHWFNPVLWFAFRRMRIDREPATDALVLSRTGESEKERYGLMLIKLLEHFNQRHSLPTLVGILEDKDQFKRRFSLIAKYTRGAYGWSLLGILLIATLAVVCLTKSKSNKTTNPGLVIETVKKGDAVALQKLIDQGADLNKIQDHDVPPLFIAGSPEVAEILIKHGADPNARDKYGRTALISLCVYRRKETSSIVNVLLNHGADPNARAGELGDTALMFAADAATIDALVAHGADIHAKLKDGTTLLVLASRQPADCFEALLRHGASFDPKNDGPTLLLHAAWINNTSLIKDLLERGADPNADGVWTIVNKKPDMMKPMLAASINGNLDSIKLLIDHGAKADEAMEAALANRHASLVKFLWEHGVRNISELSYKITQGASTSDLQKLLDQGSPIDPPQDKVFSPLDLAAQLGNLDSVKLLIARGAAVSKTLTRNPKYPIANTTPLSMAASEGQDEVIEYLLAHGAKPDGTALYEAANNSTPYEGEQRTKDHFEKSVRLLLDGGALKNTTPEQMGYVIYSSIGTRQGPPNTTVLKMLLDAGASPEAPMPYIVENGEKPNTVIGYLREQYQKLKDDPAKTEAATQVKSSLDLLEEAKKNDAPATTTPTGTSPQTSDTALSPDSIYLQALVVQVKEQDYQAHRSEIDAAVHNGDTQSLMRLGVAKVFDKPAAYVKPGKQGVFASGNLAQQPVQTLINFTPTIAGDKVSATGEVNVNILQPPPQTSAMEIRPKIANRKASFSMEFNPGKTKVLEPANAPEAISGPYLIPSADGKTTTATRFFFFVTAINPGMAGNTTGTGIKSATRTYLEVTYIQTPDKSDQPGGLVISRNAGEAMVQNPKNKATKLYDFPLQSEMNVLEGKTPAGFDFKIKLDWSTPSSDKTQALAIWETWQDAKETKGTSYGIEFKPSLHANECFLITGPWKNDSNLLIKLVDLPVESSQPAINPSAQIPNAKDTLTPVSRVTLKGTVVLDNRQMVDLDKSVGYLKSLTDVNQYEFHLQADGSFILPDVKPGFYNRNIRFVRKDNGPLPAETVEMPLTPLTVDGSQSQLSMDLHLNVPFKDQAEGFIQMGLIVAEIPDRVYHKHQAAIEAAVEKGDIAFFNQLEGCAILSYPKVATKPGTKGYLEITREFAYPTSFENAQISAHSSVPGGKPDQILSIPPTPRGFVTADVGVKAEITPTVNHEKIILNGKVSIVDFDGYTKSNMAIAGGGMPSFNTRESLFVEEMNNNQIKGFWTPSPRYQEETVTNHLANGKTVSLQNIVKMRTLLFVSARQMP